MQFKRTEGRSMIDHEIRLYRNPWSQTLANGVLLQILQTAAVNLGEKLQGLAPNGQTSEVSFGVVVMDPTENRGAREPKDYVLAAVLFGPKGESLLPNALAKADAHDRHGIPNGTLVDLASFCLGDNDFAWGYSAEYTIDDPDEDRVGLLVAIAAGSGLSAEQDREMAYMFLVEVMDQVRDRRDAWIAEQRSKGSQGWYNTANQPGPDYAAILDLEPIATL